MKFAGLILVALCCSSFGFADTFYVRKTVTGTNITDAEGNRLRNLVAGAVSSDPANKQVKKSAQAKTVYRAYVDKTAQGYALKLETVRSGKTVTSSEIVAQDTEQFSDVVKKLVDENAGNMATTAKVTTLPVKASLQEQEEDRGSGATAVSVAEPAGTEAKKGTAKNWHIALGPILSTSLLGTSAGTKYVINLAYDQALSERIDLLFQYDGNFNTSSQGGTPVTVIGAKTDFFLNDRLSNSSPFLGLDLGYGGSNRNEDAAAIGGISLGYQFFRTTDFIFEVMLRRLVVGTSATTGIEAYPTIDQLTFGIYF